MKILFLISSLKNFGGTERVVVNLANELSHFHQIDIINRESNKIDSAYEVANDVGVIKLSGSLFKFRKRLQGLIDKKKYDLIVVHNMGKLSLLVSTIKLPSRCKLWSYEHVARCSRPKWVNFLGMFLYKKYGKIITITENDAKYYYKLGHKPEVMYNPSPFEICTEYFKDSKKIIAVGRLGYQKGFDNLIKAWFYVEQKYPDWTLDIYGEGPDKESLLSLIRKNNLVNVHLCSPTTQITQVYRKGAFLVMSSRYEGLPMVLIEAQTFSLPTISFDCPFGPREIITHEQDGLLVENQNIQKLAEAMQFLMTNTEKRMFFSKNASNAAQRFTKEKIIAEWEEILNN